MPELMNSEYCLGFVLDVPVRAGTEITPGMLVVVDVDRGGACGAKDVTGTVMAGVSADYTDNRQGSVGAKSIGVWRRGRFLFDCVGNFTIKDLFRRVYSVDEHTVQLNDRGPSGPWVGNFVGLSRFPGKVWVEIDAAVNEGRRA
jgi:hypothetical protein